ncbi:MAG: hypothetical protein K6F75_12460 [Butyrivibrio sp.]|nr:hypothetical protein [Butyrivibrio sp.]
MNVIAIRIVSARVEGFAFIYFSNAEVLQEVQTPENISSAQRRLSSKYNLRIAYENLIKK